MATAIRNIPTLFGAEAEAFLHAAEEAEANPGTIDFREQTKAGWKYIINHPEFLYGAN